MQYIEKIADGIINSASQYHVVRELLDIGEPTTQDEADYIKFLISMLSVYEDESGYEH